MSTILGLPFDTFRLEGTNFPDNPGVYVITTSQEWIDVGETDKLGQRLAIHERKPCWEKNSNNLTLWVNLKYIENQQERLNLESRIRQNLDFCCGDK